MKRQLTRIKELAGSKTTRRGNILVMSTGVIIVVLAFAAFTIDFGHLAITKQELRSAADASSLAAAVELNPLADQNQVRRAAKLAARQIAFQNEAGNKRVRIRGRDDEMGRRTWDPASQTYSVSFGRNAQPYNIVRVTTHRAKTVRRTRRGRRIVRDNRLPLFFAPVLGHDKVELKETSMATYQPRDMMLVLDLSASMNDDCEFRSVNSLGQATVEGMIQEMWADLGNPTYGNLTNFYPTYLTAPGVPRNPPNGIPHIDVTWKGKEVFVQSTSSLNRVKLKFTNGRYKTFTGLSQSQGTFKGSGSTAGKIIESVWVRSGNNASQFGSNGERFDFDDDAIKAWLGLQSVPYPFASGSWRNFIDYVVNSKNGQPYYSYNVYKAGFRRKFGLMCLINFWNEKKPKNNQSADLWKASQQPITALKDSVDLLLDYITEVEAEDQVGLSVYTYPNSSGAKLESGLTRDFENVKTLSRQRQAGHYDYYTNIGAGMRTARLEFQNNGRPRAARMMVVMTDGLPNRTSTSASPTQFCLNEADLADDAKIKIMTISLGVNADTSLMQEIADRTGGTHFNVPGGQGPQDYEQQLKAVFAEIAADRPLKLIREDGLK